MGSCGVANCPIYCRKFHDVKKEENSMNNVADVVVTIVLAVIGIAVPYVSKFVKSNKTAQTLVDILPTIAQQAVVAMQATGATTYLSGEVKKSQAGQQVEASLKKLGFTKVDATTIESAVETAYAKLQSNNTLATYDKAEKPATTPEQEQQATEMQNAQSAVTVAQKALEEAQAKVVDLANQQVTK